MKTGHNFQPHRDLTVIIAMTFIALVFFADLLARLAEVFIVYALPVILLVVVVYFLFAGSGSASPTKSLSGDEQKLVNKAIAHSASAKSSRPRPKA
jgi:hypothetical protein